MIEWKGVSGLLQIYKLSIFISMGRKGTFLIKQLSGIPSDGLVIHFLEAARLKQQLRGCVEVFLRDLTEPCVEHLVSLLVAEVDLQFGRVHLIVDPPIFHLRLFTFNFGYH